MKAKVTLINWSVKECGPAFNTRQEHADGSVAYDAVSEVLLGFRLIGNEGDTRDFLNVIRNLSSGAKIKGHLEFEGRGGRKYVFE